MRKELYLQKCNERIQSINKQYFINIDEPIILKVRNSEGYLYVEKDSQGNTIRTIKLPEKDLVLDENGNLIKEETPEQTYKRIKAKLDEEIER